MSPVQSPSPVINDHEQELGQLRETVALLTSQCAQLDEANRSWQQYQQTQLHDFQTKLHDYLPISEDASYDEIMQHIIQQLAKQKEESDQKYQQIDGTNGVLDSGNLIFVIDCFNNLFYCVEPSTYFITMQQSYIDTIDRLNQEISLLNTRYEELDAEKQSLTSELEKQSIKNHEYTQQTIGMFASF